MAPGTRIGAAHPVQFGGLPIQPSPQPVESPEEEKEIPTFIMLRRMLLVAWIGSHSETDLAQEMGAEYTAVSCDLAENYLRQFT